jgi:hypothetical protein
MMDLEGAKTIHGAQHYSQICKQLMTSVIYLDCVGAVRSFILSHPDVENDTSKFIEVSHFTPVTLTHFLIVNRDGDGIIPHGLWKSGRLLYVISISVI